MIVLAIFCLIIIILLGIIKLCEASVTKRQLDNFITERNYNHMIKSKKFKYDFKTGKFFLDITFIDDSEHRYELWTCYDDFQFIAFNKQNIKISNPDVAKYLN